MRLFSSSLCFVLAALAACAAGPAASPAGPAAQRAAVSSRTAPLEAGATAPGFSLEAHTGERVSLASRLERGPVVLVFYRGSW